MLLDKPCIPEGPIVVDALLKSSVVISWKAPKDDGGSMITNYIVEKREAKEGEQWNLVSSSISGTSCRVPNLTENAGYYFRVSAQNQYGVSESLEIPSVLIIKSPFGTSVYSLSCITFKKHESRTEENKNYLYFLQKNLASPSSRSSLVRPITPVLSAGNLQAVTVELKFPTTSWRNVRRSKTNGCQ